MFVAFLKASAREFGVYFLIWTKYVVMGTVSFVGTGFLFRQSLVVLVAFLVEAAGEFGI